MAVIAPCITVETLEDYDNAIQRLTPFAERIHIDVSDGQFAPINLLDPIQLHWPSDWTVDIHAMVAYPSQYIQALVEKNPSSILLHAEASEDLLPSLQFLKQSGIRAGVVLLRSTVPELVANYIEAADYVLIFSGDLGHYGGKVSYMQLEKVGLIKKLKAGVEIGWDGGAAIDNVFGLAQGGIDVINSGGAISNAADPEAVYRQMIEEVNKKGII